MRTPPGTRAATQVAAFGDSLMWGQGLNRKDRFTELITALLPAISGGQPAVVAADASRSGAQIRARGDQGTTTSLSGGRVRDHRSQRSKFVDTFPALFAGERERTAFLDGTDERPATRLYGENPAPFPTVLGQEIGRASCRERV